MQLPLQISFVGISHKPDIEDRIRKSAQKLEKYYERITSCRVAVEVPHRHQHHGNQFRVRIDLSVPGKSIAVSRESHEETGHDDPAIAIRDAFNAAARQLEEHAERQRNH
jgi:ribosome-associated translation inhibitor RaiA